MNFSRYLSIKNLKRKPARTAALVILTAFLAFAIFGGSVIVASLQNGLSSYRSRLGADIVVVPNEARSKGTLDDILLQGIPGYFYMDSSKLDKIRSIEGVEIASPQFYLATSSAGCCSTSVQIIGFDPETDFLIQPWIRESYSGSIGDYDLIVGANISIPVSGKLTFYNTECRVAAQLDQTGTGLDSAIYANMNTIKEMMRSANALGFDYFSDVDADHAVSSVMVKVADGYSAEDVTGDINIHVRRVEATQAKTMVSSIAGGLSGVSAVIGVLIGLVWVLAFVILLVAFTMITNERTKEFAILRVVGASQKTLSALIRTESLMISAGGAVIGTALSCVIVFPFSSVIGSQLGLPYLMPGIIQICLIAAGSVAASMLAGILTSLISGSRIQRNETALVLREGA